MKSIFFFLAVVFGAVSASGAEGVDHSVFLTEEEARQRNLVFKREMEHRSLIILEGDIVGNGGGYLEGAAHVYYRTLPTIIRSAIDSRAVSFSATEIHILEEIARLIVSSEREAKIVFLPRKEARGLFLLESDPAERLAKTGFSPGFPIFFNLELLNEIGGDVKLVLLTSLVHELGHQVKVASHRLLDGLAGKIVRSLLISRTVLEKVRPNSGDRISVEILNFSHGDRRLEVNIAFGAQNISLRPIALAGLKSVCGGVGVKGYEVHNAQWVPKPKLQWPGQHSKEKIAADLIVNCAGGVLRSLPLTIEMDVRGDEISGRLLF